MKRVCREFGYPGTLMENKKRSPVFIGERLSHSHGDWFESKETNFRIMPAHKRERLPITHKVEFQGSGS
jgi:hypothetical protein